MYRVLLIAIALIVYGSLWPWQYNPAHVTGNPFWILFHSWRAKTVVLNIQDIVVNLLLYIPVGMFGYLALDRHHHRRLRIIGPILLGFALSCSIEMLQVYDIRRDCSALDLLCNTISTVLGVALGYVFRQSHLASLRRISDEARLHTSGPLVLIFIWVGFQTIPLFPITFKVLPKIHALWPAHFSWMDALTSLCAWLIVARLLEAIYDPKLGWRLVLLLSVLVPVKLLIANRTPTVSEVCGLVVALMLFKAVPAGLASRSALLAGLTLLVLSIQGLRPFHLTARNTFSWVPFVGLLTSPWEIGLVTLCEKSFWYGSAVWLLFAAGRGLWPATGVVAALLAVIEVIQIRLPGRTAEITDPVLGLLLGLILWFLEVHGRRSKVRMPDPAIAELKS